MVPLNELDIICQNQHFKEIDIPSKKYLFLERKDGESEILWNKVISKRNKLLIFIRNEWEKEIFIRSK